MRIMQVARRAMPADKLLMLALITLVMMLPSVSVYAAYITGVITENVSGTPIPGVTVVNVNGWGKVTTDANGYYRIYAANYSDSNQLLVWHPNYFQPPRWKNPIGAASGTYTVDWKLVPLITKHQIFDSFNRADTNNPLETPDKWCTGDPSKSVGSTEDAGHYPWLISFIRPKADIKSNALRLAPVLTWNCGNTYGDDPLNHYNYNPPGWEACGSFGWGEPWTSTGVSLGEISADDFELTTVIKSIEAHRYTFSNGSPGTNWAAICWHQVMTNTDIGQPFTTPGNDRGQYSFGMALMLHADPNNAGKITKITLAHYWFGTESNLKQYTPPTPIDWSQSHTIKIRVQGNHYQVFLDGGEILAFTEQSPYGFIVTDRTWNNPSVAPFIASRNPTYFGFYRDRMTGINIDSVAMDLFQPATGSISGTVTSTDPTLEIKKTGRIRLGTQGGYVTDEDGKYSIANVPEGDYKATAVADGYYPKTVTVHIGSGPVVVDFALTPLPAASEVVTDDFNRPDSNDLGTTTDAKHYKWNQTADANSGISMEFMYLGMANNCGVSIGRSTVTDEPFQPADMDATVYLQSFSVFGTAWGGIAYRQNLPGTFGNSADAGYLVSIYDQSVVLSRNGNTIARGTMPQSVTWFSGIPLRIRAIGPQHEVWLNNFQVINALDYGKMDGGYFSIVRDQADLYAENLLINVYPKQSIPYLPVERISDLKDLPDGTEVSLNEAFITAVFNGFFYIEEEDRSCGIKVVGTTTFQSGKAVTIQGTVKTADGERYIQARNVAGTTSPDKLIAPLGMTGRAAFGTDGIGGVGLLTTIWGKVTSVGSDHFYIEDGSGISTGVKVMINATKKPAVDDYVSCTGISRMTTGPVHVLHLRSDAELVILD